MNLCLAKSPNSSCFQYVLTATGVILEEDLTDDGLHFDTGTSAFEMPAEQIDAEDVEDCNQDMDVNPAGERSTTRAIVIAPVRLLNTAW